MITEPEMGDEPDGRWDSGASEDTVVAEPMGRQRLPWLWVLGTVVATSAVWALALQATRYGDAASPDLHHYRLSAGPCSGYSLKPLIDVFGVSHVEAAPVDTRSSPALDQAQCTLTAHTPAEEPWLEYSVAVTVELHKKIDPAVEFEDNLPGGYGPAQSSDTAKAGETGHAIPVAGLGDKAYLLVYDDSNLGVRVLHGGAVFTVDVNVYPGGVPSPHTNGYPQQQPPSVNRLRPAVIATARTIMSALSR